jgi:hypothetical protein
MRNGRVHSDPKEHLVRMAGLFVVGLVVFLLVRAAFVPKDFGEYGHYRAGALDDNRDRPLVYAGGTACEACHSDVADTRKGSKHAGIGCETCHGPQAQHAGADDPGTFKPKRPDPKTICLMCHLENAAKPAKFPQVNPKDHGDGQPCASCHKPHRPEISTEPPNTPPPTAKTAGSEVKN